MKVITRVDNIEDANICDELLTKLIQDECKYDDSLDKNFVVKDYFSNAINNKDNVLLSYKVDNKIVGYAYFKPTMNDDKHGYLIDGLYVLDEYRNQGIAKSLIKEGLDIIGKVDFIDINVMYDNTIARKLYSSLGFKDLKITMRQS
jgi:ribosomal protein S18 acetylase RimI-like enzyme